MTLGRYFYALVDELACIYVFHIYHLYHIRAFAVICGQVDVEPFAKMFTDRKFVIHHILGLQVGISHAVEI